MKKNLKKTIKKITGLLLPIILLLSLFGCDNQNPRAISNPTNLTQNISAEVPQGKPCDEAFLTSAADFSIDLFKQSLSEDESHENLLLSPESVLVALSMTANGASGSTRSEMETLLGNGTPISEWNAYLYEYNQKLTNTNDVSFHMGNSIWINETENLQIQEHFLSTAKSYYDAFVFLEPFDNDCLSDMNQWVSHETDNMIHHLYSEISPNASLYLTNALAFNGKWNNSYTDEQIHEETFTNHDGTSSTVTMLNSSETVFVKDDHATGFIKYYEGEQYAFLALLPESGMSVAEYAATLTGESYLEMYENQQSQEVLVKLPEFSYDYTTELKPALQQMGMHEAFSGSADFCDLTESIPLKIDSVLHKACIQVDRNGTKAAAVTSVIMDKATAIEEPEPVCVYLDRPFVYAIIDVETGLPVFMGTITTL